jgi:hypothetical protein
MLKRLTVHLTNVKPVREKVGTNPKDGKPATRVVLNNTLSVHNLKSELAISTALSDIRSSHTIATCKTPKHSMWKVGDEMWYTSNEK